MRRAWPPRWNAESRRDQERPPLKIPSMNEQPSARQFSAWRDRKPLVFAIPMAVYALDVALAFSIGREYSCKGGFELYFWFGLLSLPALAATAFVFGPVLHVLVRTVLCIASVATGILTWSISFGASGMYFMCKLF